jgi:hypothetical protein
MSNRIEQVNAITQQLLAPPSLDTSDVLSIQKYLNELQTAFANQLEAVVYDESFNEYDESPFSRDRDGQLIPDTTRWSAEGRRQAHEDQQRKRKRWAIMDALKDLSPIAADELETIRNAIDAIVPLPK